MTTRLGILYQDERMVAVHKPAGMLVHRSSLARHDSVFVLQLLRDQVGQRLYPLHRLDRATSGVLLFALDPHNARRLGETLNSTAHKSYRAVVRGWTPAGGVIDHPVRDRDMGKRSRPARTDYRRVAMIEIAHPVDRYPTSRYSLVAIQPKTGRRHQIRQHFKHICHPLVGDTTYGHGPHNRFFRRYFGIDRLLLEADRLAFPDPDAPGRIVIECPPDATWARLLDMFSVADATK